LVVDRRIKVHRAGRLEEGNEERIVHEFVDYTPGLLKFLGVRGLRLPRKT